MEPAYGHALPIMEENHVRILKQFYTGGPDEPITFANYVQVRRQALRLTVEQAANLSGLAFSKWCALEAGWIPDAPNVLWAIAGTLQASTTGIALLAGSEQQDTAV